jgi:methionyl-tRNA formyltransferase
MFIYGTGIVGKRVLSLPTLKCLNLHTGISPYYRGSDAFFWPLYNSEPHMVGATVHECTAAIDGGDILARASVRLEENDDPFISFARCVKSGARIYSEAARNIMSGEKMRLEKQDLSSGREYRFVDRTFTHDIVMEYMVRSGKLRRIIEESFQRDLPFPLREDP